MSIEELAASMGKSPDQLFSDLMAEVDLQVAQLNILSPTTQTVFRNGFEDFSLERGDVKLLIKRIRPTVLFWARLESAGANTLPKTDRGEIETLQGSYWVNGRRFQSTKEAALFIVGIVSRV